MILRLISNKLEIPTRRRDRSVALNLFHKKVSLPEICTNFSCQTTWFSVSACEFDHANLYSVRLSCGATLFTRSEPFSLSWLKIHRQTSITVDALSIVFGNHSISDLIAQIKQFWGLLSVLSFLFEVNFKPFSSFNRFRTHSMECSSRAM